MCGSFKSAPWYFRLPTGVKYLSQFEIISLTTFLSCQNYKEVPVRDVRHVLPFLIPKCPVGTNFWLYFFVGYKRRARVVNRDVQKRKVSVLHPVTISCKPVQPNNLFPQYQPCDLVQWKKVRSVAEIPRACSPFAANTSSADDEAT